MLLKSDPDARIVHSGSNGAGVIENGSEHLVQAESTNDTLGIESPIHPLGIKPAGNKLWSIGTTDAREAIGTFQALPDGMQFSHPRSPTTTTVATHVRFQRLTPSLQRFCLSSSNFSTRCLCEN